MVQTKTLVYDYDMPWEVVVWAFDQKFWAVPTPDQPDVLEVKFSDYGFDSDGQVSKFHRSAVVKLNAPGWMLTLAGTDRMVLHADASIDRKKRVYHCVGVNETFRTRMEMDEDSTLAPHPDDPQKTRLTIKGSLNLKISAWLGKGPIERLIIPRYKAMIDKAREMERPKLDAAHAKFKGKKVPLTKSECEARQWYEKETGKTIADEYSAADADAAAAATNGDGAKAGDGAADGAAGAASAESNDATAATAGGAGGGAGAVAGGDAGATTADASADADADAPAPAPAPAPAAEEAGAETEATAEASSSSS